MPIGSSERRAGGQAAIKGALNPHAAKAVRLVARRNHREAARRDPLAWSALLPSLEVVYSCFRIKLTLLGAKMTQTV